MFNDSSHERTSSIFWFTFIYIFLTTITIIAYAFEYLKQPHKRRIRGKYARVVAARKIKKKKMYNSESTSTFTSIAEAETHTHMCVHVHIDTLRVFLKMKFRPLIDITRLCCHAWTHTTEFSHWLPQELSCQYLSDKWKTIHVVKKKQLCHWTMTIMFDL